MSAFSILVVDDSELVRLVTADFLRSEGYVVVEAEDALHALALVEQGGIDLVVMDIQMPGMNGIEATRRVHALDPSLPVLAFTGSPHLLQDKHELFQGVFSKPTSLNQLLKSIQVAEIHRGRIH